MIEKFYVSDDVANDIENLLLNDDYFPWYFHSTTVKSSEEIKKSTNVDSPQLTHIFYQNAKITSDYFKNVIKILQHSKLPLSKIDCVRIKANLNFPLHYQKNLNNVHQAIHTDAPENHKSFLYYVNDSDGDTLFFDDNLNEIDRVSPKKGMGVLFNSNIKHAGQNPINSKVRAAINFIWKE
jgi:hypothetical protein